MITVSSTHELDSHFSLEVFVEREKHHPHTPGAEHIEHTVMVPDDTSEGVREAVACLAWTRRIEQGAPMTLLLRAHRTYDRPIHLPIHNAKMHVLATRR